MARPKMQGSGPNQGPSNPLQQNKSAIQLEGKKAFVPKTLMCNPVVFILIRGRLHFAVR